MNWKKTYRATLFTVGITAFSIGAGETLTEQYNQISGKNRPADACEIKARTGQACTPDETRELAKGRGRAQRQAEGFMEMLFGAMLLESARQRKKKDSPNP